MKDKFARLDNGLTIGSWGQIKEWKYDTWQLDTLGNQHRHLSNLIALYPGNKFLIIEHQNMLRQQSKPCYPEVTWEQDGVGHGR